MADIMTACRAKMLATSTITALVSTRVYPNHAAQGATLPHVVYREISSVEHSHLRGTLGTAETRIQFDCVSDSPAAARELRETIRATLRKWRGTQDGVEITDVQTGARFSRHQPAIDGDQVGKHVFAMDLVFHHSEPVITDE